MNGNSQESQNNISLCQKINSRALQTPRPNRFLLKQRLRTPASVRVFQHSMDHDERLKNCLPAGVSDDVPAVAVVAYLLIRRLLFYIGSIEWELSQQHWPDQTMRRAPHLL